MDCKCFYLSDRFCGGGQWHCALCSGVILCTRAFFFLDVVLFLGNNEAVLDRMYQYEGV